MRALGTAEDTETGPISGRIRHFRAARKPPRLLWTILAPVAEPWREDDMGNLELHRGDLVEVKSPGEILATLRPTECDSGSRASFMNAAVKMLTPKIASVTLEGVVCSGDSAVCRWCPASAPMRQIG